MTKNTAIHQAAEDLFLIDLDLPLDGFRKFISSWLYVPQGIAILVDPGPEATIPALLDALKEKDIRRLDFILLTHIHADHAGGAGLISSQYPEARVICHPKGIPHMVDPAKLWEGTQKTLGRVAAAYGPIAPVAAERISFEHAVRQNGFFLEVFETPGHAAHHLSYRCGDILFAGEVAGIQYPLPGGGYYTRPGTPPVFIYEILKESLQTVSQLKASTFCFGHYGWRLNDGSPCGVALEQLADWLAIVKADLKKDAQMPDDDIFADLLAKDRHLTRYGELPPDIQARERFFCFNSIRGMREYLLQG